MHRRADSEAQPLDATATNLVPQLGDSAYRGKLETPPAGQILENPGSTIHQLALDVTAHDGDRVVARSSLELQVIDDPAEFRDPRPDRSQLKELAQATAGRVIRTPEELATVLAQHPEASVRQVVTRLRLSGTPPYSGCSCWVYCPANGSSAG